MQARVKQSYRWSSLVALIGREFVKGEWRPVPAGMEEEAEANEFLEVKEATPPTPPVPESGEGEAAPEKEIEASPAAAKLAEEYGIDLATIKGTGAGGKVIKPDVDTAIDALSEEGENSEVS